MGKGKAGIRKKRKKGAPKLPEKPTAAKEPSQIGELLRVGKQRGFITEDEILHAIPEVEKHLS